MKLSATEEAFVNAFRQFSATTAEELAGLVQRLATLAPNAAIDWSDSWSDTDLEAYSVASLRSADADDSGELL